MVGLRLVPGSLLFFRIRDGIVKSLIKAMLISILVLSKPAMIKQAQENMVMNITVTCLPYSLQMVELL